MSDYLHNMAERIRRQDQRRAVMYSLLNEEGEFSEPLNDDEKEVLKAFLKRNAQCGRRWRMHHYLCDGAPKKRPVDGRCCGAACACESCAARRQAILGRKITLKVKNALKVEGRVAYFMTLTIPTGPDLEQQFTKLEDGIRYLMNQARKYRNSPHNHPFTVFSTFLASICCIEVKRSRSNPEHWHVHAHFLTITGAPAESILAKWTPDRRLQLATAWDAQEKIWAAPGVPMRHRVKGSKKGSPQFRFWNWDSLSELERFSAAVSLEWCAVTEAGWQGQGFERLRAYDRLEKGEIDDLFDGDKGIQRDIAELIKYPTKFSAMSPEDLVQLLLFLRGVRSGKARRILRYYGRRDVLSIEEADLEDFEAERDLSRQYAYQVWDAVYEGHRGSYSQEFLYSVDLEGIATLPDGYQLPASEVAKFLKPRAPVKLSAALRAVKKATMASGEWKETNSNPLAEERALLARKRLLKRLPSDDSSEDDVGFYGTEEGIALMNQACLPLSKR